MCEHPIIFLTILNSRIFQDKKIVVHSKPFIKIIGILLLVVRFVKSSDQTIIQIIRKNESVLILLVCNLQPSTNFTKNSVLGVASLRSASGTL